jgi:PAS domain S-box-containing protein
MSDVPKLWWKATCEAVSLPIACVSPDNKFVWCNSAYEKLTGYSLAELRDKTWMDITVTRDIGGDLRSATDIVLGNSDHYQTSKRYRHKNGTEVHTQLAVWRFPVDVRESITCFIVEASHDEISHAEFVLTVEDLKKRLRKMEENERSGINVNVGDRLKNDPQMIKYLIGGLTVVALAIAYLFYYVATTATDNKPEPPKISQE